MRTFLVLLICAPICCLAAGDFELDYNPTTRHVEAEVGAGVKSVEILGALSERVGFELVFDDHDATIQPGMYSGEIDEVLRTLVIPASVVLIKSDEGVLRSVDILPVGQKQDSLPLSQKTAAERFFRNGSYTGPEHNREKAQRWLNR